MGVGRQPSIPWLGLEQYKLASAVAGKGGFVQLGVGGAILAKAHRANPVGAHPQACQSVAHAQRAALAQRPVIFLGAALVAVPL